MMFAKRPQQQPEAQGITPARLRELSATVDAEEAAAAEIAAAERPTQGDTQWRGGVGRKRITQSEAEVIKRRIIGPRRRFFTLSERMDFLAEYEVIAEEPMPIPESTHHHADILRARASVAAQARAAAPPPMQPKPNRFVAAVKVLLGVEEPAAAVEPQKPKVTFFN